MIVTWDVDPRHYKQREEEVEAQGFYSHTPPPSYREACEDENPVQTYQHHHRFHFIDQPVDEESGKTTQKELTALGTEEHPAQQQRTCCDALLHILGF